MYLLYKLIQFYFYRNFMDYVLYVVCVFDIKFVFIFEYIAFFFLYKLADKINPVYAAI